MNEQVLWSYGAMPLMCFRSYRGVQMNEGFKYTNPEMKVNLLKWLSNQYGDAKQSGCAEYMWCLDLKNGEDIALIPSGTIAQIKDDIEKKHLPLQILRVFRTDKTFESQIEDL